MSQTLDALVVELRADVRGLQTSLQTAAGDVSRFSNTATRNIDGFQASILRARTAIMALGVAWAGFRVGKGIVDAGMQMEAMRNRMRAATGDSAIAAESLSFVRDEAQRLGLDIRATADGFSGFAASALRAGLTFQQTKEIFTGVSEAATSMRLGGEQVALVFKALEQIAGKGTVSMEELRGQLGDALPGAFEIAAKSMGKTTSEFAKMVANGEVLSSDFLPKFGAAVRQELGGSVEEASKGAQAAFNRMGNAFFDLQTKMAESGFLDAITGAVNEMTAALNDPATVDGLKGFATLLGDIVTAATKAAAAIGSFYSEAAQRKKDLASWDGTGNVFDHMEDASRTRALRDKVLADFTAKQQGIASGKPATPDASASDSYTLGTKLPVGETTSAAKIKEMERLAREAKQLRERLAGQAESMRYQFAGPEQQATMDVEGQQKTLREALEAKAITEQEFRELSLEAEMAYQERLQEIRDLAREQELTSFEAFLGTRLKSQEDLNKATLKEQGASFARSIQMAAQHNKLFFAMEKARAIAAALISARESVVHAYNFGARIGGPFLGAAFAGVAAAAQAANIAAIASTSNGGGGSASFSGSDGGGEYGGGAAAPAASAAPTKIMQVTLVGSELASWSKNQIRDFIDLLNDAQRDGSRIQVVNA